MKASGKEFTFSSGTSAPNLGPTHPNKGEMHEHTVTHAGHRCHASAGKEEKRRQKYSRSPAEMRKQEVTYSDPRAHTRMLQGRQMPASTENRGDTLESAFW
ncbi:hypothetical protein Y1Q_0015272 [Alligator mississippiensis]|uniref:Uncharacterized protein n=1 Tax=Alligator mississippiensis TaxID=8496 RepID=A0A151LZA9_ALLMI|nr:hypothetical protein Y1Q_0015272 [Alligator mississippiensis]